MAKKIDPAQAAPAPPSTAPSAPVAPLRAKTVDAGCPKCGASGYFGDNPVVNLNPFCPQCKGRGKISAPIDLTKSCPDCNGRGHVENVPCFPCAHTGKIVA
jgi:hypothetical protein